MLRICLELHGAHFVHRSPFRLSFGFGTPSYTWQLEMLHKSGKTLQFLADSQKLMSSLLRGRITQLQVSYDFLLRKCRKWDLLTAGGTDTHQKIWRIKGRQDNGATYFGQSWLTQMLIWRLWGEKFWLGGGRAPWCNVSPCSYRQANFNL